MIRLLVLFLMLGSSLAMSAGAAHADWVRVSGKDKDDGSLLQGIALKSDDGLARMFFLCDSDKNAPQILVSHPHVIGKAAEPFRLTYIIDDRDEEIHWFLAKGSGKTGYFFVRYPQEYQERFGTQPEPFTPGSNAINPEYLSWDRNIYLTVVHDFVTGTVALVRIRDKQKKNHYYSFILIGMENHIDALASCYQPPVVPEVSQQ